MPLILLLALLGLSACVRAQTPKMPIPIVKQQISDSAMVVTAHPLATRVGVQILRQGGNAIDAMVAVQFALAVVYPRAGNIGGGGFMVYRAANGDLATLDFREKAPLKAHRDMYLDAKGNAIAAKSLEGHLAAGVPGSVAGMYAAHQKYGKLPWVSLLQPAIDLAEKGTVLTYAEAAGLNEYRRQFIRLNPTYLPDLAKQAVWKVGDTLFQPQLAWTLQQIRDRGMDGFYQGPVADSIVADMQANGGIISHEDLRRYQAQWREPLVGYYQGHKIISMPPVSSGGVALIQLLQSVEPYPLESLGFHSPMAIHIMVEAERRVYADRAKHLGDPDFYTVPLRGLLDTAYNRQRMASVSLAKASKSQDIAAGTPAKEGENTTHFSIVDAQGNAISVTTTINTNYGAKAIARGAGFLWNNEMDDFSAKPGSPNVFGLLGGEANAIVPEKRMLSSMTPTIVEKEGKLLLVLGTPGGSTIITSVFQVIVNVLTFKLPLKEAVHAPRFHHQWKPDQISYERGGFPTATLKALQAKGHLCKPRGSIGQLEAIMVLPNGKLEGVADKRGEDHAEGY